MSGSTIYVKLLNEGTDVWAPAAAEHVDQDRYRIVQNFGDDDEPEFSRGQIVRCKMKNLSDGEVLVAFQESKPE
jgi:hypothetical protein